MQSNEDQQTRQTMRTLSSEMLDELRNDILPFWMYRAVDIDKGGYYGRISNDLTIDSSADKGGILHARILWTFSAAFRLFGDRRYLKSAQHAYEFLIEHFWDTKYGGVFWLVDNEGNIRNDRKQAYNLAFAIYGLSEYYRVSCDEGALSKAREIFYILEKNFKDNMNGGYIEAAKRDYSPIADFRLSDKDRNDIKSMNTHLHILEAYTNLLRVWEDGTLKIAQSQLLKVMLDHIVDPQKNCFRLFFNETWECTSHTVSYGHDIEGSWLMCEAADVLGDEELKKRSHDTAVKMAYKVLENGIDHACGGIYYEEECGRLDSDKHWWPLAEAVVGFLNAYGITKDESFLKAACETWDYIKNYVIDKEYGEWFWRCSREGEPRMGEPKVDFWKCPYHNARSCMEIHERAELLPLH